MNIFGHAAGSSRPRLGTRSLVAFLSLALTFTAWPQNLLAQDAPAPDEQTPAQATQAPPYTQQTPEQLQRLVAPIALYPDSLVAQVLAASTFPEQIVEADRWVQANPTLKGDDLGKAVDQQPWDPSVKALAAFPSVLGNMDKNLSWASSLGDAYFNQQSDVMDAVQVMRRRAQAAGDLKSTEQQTVATQDSNIIIEPTNPEVVYVPAYDPWLVYGDPVMAWPGWYPYPGIWFGGPNLQFGGGFGIGWYGGFGWGWGNWGFNWGGRYPMYNHGRYYSGSRTFYNRSSFYRAGSSRGPMNGERGGLRGGANPGNRAGNGGRSGFNGERGGLRGGANPGTGAGSGGRSGYNGERGGVNNRSGAIARPFDGNRQAARGYTSPRGQSGVRSGAFSGYDHGGQTKSYASRGNASASHSAPARGSSGAAHSSAGSRSSGGGSRSGGERH